MHHIIIPAVDVNDKCRDWLDNLLTSIRDGGYYENDYHVIICYDNASQEFQDYFKEKYKGDFIVAVDNQNKVRLNFASNSNTGLRIAFQAAKGMGNIDDIFTVLNMDTILPRHDLFSKVPGEGLSFPTPVDNPLSMKLTKASEEVLAKNGFVPQRTPVTKFSGFCMCMSYALIDKIGFLDERFQASFEDDSLCADALLAGFPVEVVSVDVHHELKDRTTPSNTGAYDNASLGLHMDIFRRKYSIPHYIQHEQFNQWIVDNHTWVPERRNE